MPESTEVKRRRVMARDHDAIASFISEEKERREQSKWRERHERRWVEIDRQISQEPPHVIDKSDTNEPLSWHNAIQLGDLSDASEIFTADALRLSLPTERKFFHPHVEVTSKEANRYGIEQQVDEFGEEIPIPPEQQRIVDDLLRNLLVQQQKDFGFRARCKLALKEIYHHGSVVCTVEMERMPRYHDGTKVETLKAPALRVHSMWDCFPDPSPSVMSTELFYRGSMIIRRMVPLRAALEMPGWINKDRLVEQNKELELDDHIEILTFYGDIFLKRHDGNVLFPNRRTTVNENVFLESKINETSYSPVIYTGYERDDVRDPYYTSPIVKLAPMAKFATHMANRTMDSVDLAVDPPIEYNYLNSSMDSEGPEIYPGARNPTRGNSEISVLNLGNPEMGLAGLQFARQAISEGTSTDSVRKGVAAGTEQTATEIVKTEQRGEVRSVEFVATFDSEFLLPFLYMQHELNLKKMETYPFFNDEMHTPDFVRAQRSDLPDTVVMEVTGSRTLLGEEQRTARMINTITLVAQLEPLAKQVDWQEVSRQVWEDTRVKDPERFMITSDRNAEQQAALEAQAQQFQELIQQLQGQLQQAQQAVIQAQQAQQKAEFAAVQNQLQIQQERLRHEQTKMDAERIDNEAKIEEQLRRAEDKLRAILDEIKAREAKLACDAKENSEKQKDREQVLSMVKQLSGTTTNE